MLLRLPISVIIVAEGLLPASLGLDGFDDGPLQLLGVVDDQDHWQGAVPCRAAFQRAQPAAMRIGVTTLVIFPDQFRFLRHDAPPSKT